MDQIMVQELEDARVRRILKNNKVLQQEAVAKFILSCATLAYDLNQMCMSRRLCSYPVEELEKPAAYITAAIKEQFRKQFGYELFNKESK